MGRARVRIGAVEGTLAPRAAGFESWLTGARVCDPAGGLDRICDVAIAGDRIAAVGDGLVPSAHRIIDLSGKLVTPGWVDLHVHVFE